MVIKVVKVGFLQDQIDIAGVFLDELLTSILSNSGNHHPRSDPVLQREPSGHGSALELLWVRLQQLCEPGVHESLRLASEGSHRIHGAGVNSEETRLVQGTDAGRGQVEPLGFVLDVPGGWRRVCFFGVWMRGRRVGPAQWQRAAAGAPAVVEPWGCAVDIRPRPRTVRQ